MFGKDKKNKGSCALCVTKNKTVMLIPTRT